MALGATITDPAAPASKWDAVSGGASLEFDVAYNKSVTNLQGNATLSVSAGGKDYRVKSNSLASLVRVLGSTTTDATASLSSKASILDVTNPNGKDGGVVYSNNFIPATGKTNQQAISTGDIVIK